MALPAATMISVGIFQVFEAIWVTIRDSYWPLQQIPTVWARFGLGGVVVYPIHARLCSFWSILQVEGVFFPGCFFVDGSMEKWDWLFWMVFQRCGFAGPSWLFLTSLSRPYGRGGSRINKKVAAVIYTCSFIFKSNRLTNLSRSWSRIS